MSNLVPLFVSIDWDAFIHIRYDHPLTSDWSNVYENECSYLVWKQRELRCSQHGLGMHELARLAIDPVRWWEAFQGALIHPLAACTVSESHAEIVRAIDGLENYFLDIRLVNIDAHADLGYMSHSPRANQHRIQCDDWFGVLLKRGTVAYGLQVYPSWRSRLDECNGEQWPVWFGDRIAFHHDAEEFSLRRVADHFGVRYDQLQIIGIHICRSGAWSPPIYDGAFSVFVAHAPISSTSLLGLDLADPLERRYDESFLRWSLPKT